MRQLLNTIKAGTTLRQRREMDLISEKEARLLFRVTNFFNPQCILQALAVRVLKSQLDRVECYDDVNVAADDFLAGEAASRLALVNSPADETVLKRFLDAQCVLVLRNLNHDESMSALFDTCCQHMPMGQTYTNDKIAILNPNPKLQREDFLLWL